MIKSSKQKKVSPINQFKSDMIAAYNRFEKAIAKPEKSGVKYETVDNLMKVAPVKYKQTFFQGMTGWHDKTLRYGQRYTKEEAMKDMRIYPYFQHNSVLDQLLESERIPGTNVYIKRANWYFAA